MHRRGGSGFIISWRGGGSVDCNVVAFVPFFFPRLEIVSFDPKMTFFFSTKQMWMCKVLGGRKKIKRNNNV